MATKNFKTAKEAIREATAPTDTNFSEDQERPARRTGKAERHINIVLNDDQLTFLKAFCKIRGESYSETISAMIERAQRENSDLVALVERAKAAL